MDTLFSAQVRTGDRKAWGKIRATIKKAGSINKSAEPLGVSRRQLYQWLSDVDGLREYCKVGGR